MPSNSTKILLRKNHSTISQAPHSLISEKPAEIHRIWSCMKSFNRRTAVLLLCNACVSAAFWTYTREDVRYRYIRVKVKVTPQQATKAQRGRWCTALLFLQPRRKMGVGGQHHAPAALSPGKTRYTLGGPKGRSWRVQKISPPTGIRSPDRPVHSESLYRLSYPGPPVTDTWPQ